MEENTKLCLVGIIMFCTTFIECNRYVTTVYKSNIIRSKSDHPRYLNTCSVSVYLENNHDGLPLFNTKDGNPLFMTISPLHNSSDTSEWQMENKGTLQTLSAPMYRMWQDEEVLLHWTSKTYESYSQDIFECSQNCSNLMYGNKVLRVTFKSSDNANGFEIKYIFEGAQKVSVKFPGYNSNNRWELCFSNQTDCHTSQYSEGNVIFEISIIGQNLRIIDLTPNSNLHVGKIPSEFGELQHLTHYTEYYSGINVDYKILQIQFLNETNSLVSPWIEINRDISLFILFYSTIGNIEINPISIYLEGQSEEDIMTLDFYDVDKDNLNWTILTQNYDDPTYMRKWVKKVTVINPQEWTGEKRIRITTRDPSIMIGNIWEGKDELQIKLQKKHNCVQFNDVEIYNVPYVNMYSAAYGPSICYLGGQLKAIIFSQPTGFIDNNRCETECNRNRFGQNCSLVCSKSSSGCKGMVLCTELYGCSCAPGYHGEKCLEQCGKGLYGADCKQTCSIGCTSGCDMYTGNCHGECKVAYLFGIKCDLFESQLKEPPVFVDSNFTSVTLNINLTENNIERPQFCEKSTPKFFMIQYHEDKNATWNNKSYVKYDPLIESVSIDGLKPGCTYIFNVLILEELDKNDVRHTTVGPTGYTRCVAPVRKLEASKITNTSIDLTWKPTEEQENECPFLSYILVVEEVDGLNAFQIDDIMETSYKIENLTPSQTYYVVLKERTVSSESDPTASINVTTSDY